CTASARGLSVGGSEPRSGETCSPQITLREEHAVRGGVQRREQLAGQTRLNATCLLWIDQVADNRVEPGIGIHAENHDWPLLHFEIVHRRARQQIAVELYFFHHRLP